MRLRDQRLNLAWLVLVLLLAALAFQWRAYQRDARFNRALVNADLVTAAEHPSAHGAFASAVAHQRKGQDADALAAYASLALGATQAPGRAAPGAERTLANARRYNLALIWLAQAVKLEGSNEPELGVPLVELAKQAWRDVLRSEQGAFDARHNLAQALQILPNLRALTADEEDMPERSPRAPQAARAIDRLP